MLTYKRRVRCDHAQTSVLIVAGIVKENCDSCGSITLVATDWESDFELAR